MLSDEDLNNHLSCFILEVNRQDDAPYPPDTLFQHLRSEQPNYGTNKMHLCQEGYATGHIPPDRDISYTYTPLALHQPYSN